MARTRSGPGDTAVAAIPPTWDGARFDVIWAFTLVPGSAPAQYAFAQIPQQLLSGDTASPIPA